MGCVWSAAWRGETAWRGVLNLDYHPHQCGRVSCTALREGMGAVCSFLWGICQGAKNVCWPKVYKYLNNFNYRAPKTSAVVNMKLLFSVFSSVLIRLFEGRSDQKDKDKHWFVTWQQAEAAVMAAGDVNSMLRKVESLLQIVWVSVWLMWCLDH